MIAEGDCDPPGEGERTGRSGGSRPRGFEPVSSSNSRSPTGVAESDPGRSLNDLRKAWVRHREMEEPDEKVRWLSLHRGGRWLGLTSTASDPPAPPFHRRHESGHFLLHREKMGRYPRRCVHRLTTPKTGCPGKRG